MESKKLPAPAVVPAEVQQLSCQIEHWRRVANRARGRSRVSRVKKRGRRDTGACPLQDVCAILGEWVLQMRSLQEHFDSLLRVLKAELIRHYGDRLVSVVVFGSVGRGTPGFDSDVDILIVGEPLPNGRLRRVREFDAIERGLSRRLLTLERTGIHTSLAPVFKTPSEVRRGSLLFLDMIDDGEILYDRSGFWQDYVAALRERLSLLGARKIVQGDRWYWDLKPDYRAGEVFEI